VEGQSRYAVRKARLSQSSLPVPVPGRLRIRTE
jgi:hypothetical protein